MTLPTSDDTRPGDDGQVDMTAVTARVSDPVVQDLYRLRADAELRIDADGALVLRQSRFRLSLEQPGMSRRALLLRLGERWVGDAEIGRLVSGIDGESQVLPAQLLLRRLLGHSWLERRIQVGDRPLLDLLPTGLGRGTMPQTVRHGAAVHRLSRFAALQHERGALIASTPLSTVSVGCVDVRVGMVLATAVAGVDVAAVASTLAVHPEVARRIIDELAAARILVSEADFTAEHEQAPLAYWSPEELRLHHRSRAGQHALPVGGTYRFRDRFTPEPFSPAAAGGPSVVLTVPDPEVVAKNDESFSRVVAARRSVRRHDDAAPLTGEQLAEFLYRVQHSDAIADNGGQQVGRRPYPGGGGIYELEIFPLVARSRGLDRGLYRYDATGHRLDRIAGWGPAADRLLGYARAAGAMSQVPQTLLVVTARVQRLMWKYEGMSYAMILKDAGVLTHQMYLVATAMGLAPCALGTGDSASFARLSGLDPLVEPSVADFLLGTAEPT